MERLISHIHFTHDATHSNSVDDPPGDGFIALFQDASFVGYIKGSMSTRGGLLALIGPTTFVTLAGTCNSQTAVSHSSVEAYVNSLDARLMMAGNQPWFGGVRQWRYYIHSRLIRSCPICPRGQSACPPPEPPWRCWKTLTILHTPTY